MSETPNDRLEVTLPSDREVTLIRSFAAPRELVFEAWTKPEHLARWFGSRSSTVEVRELDLRPGGAWVITLKEADGSQFTMLTMLTMRGVYREIVPPERIVYTESFDEFGGTANEAVVTMTFEEENGRTTIVSTSLYPSKEIRDAIVESGMEHGAAETYDRLAEHLVVMAQ